MSMMMMILAGPLPIYYLPESPSPVFGRAPVALGQSTSESLPGPSKESVW
jgi:hypothetical protein